MYGEAIGLVMTAAEHHEAFGQLLARWWDRLTRGHTRLVILGGGGVGKSSLGRLSSRGSIGESDYRESHEVETYRLAGGTSCSIHVPPGQARLRDATWTELEAFLSREHALLVHLVSWGLNEIAPLAYTMLPQHRPSMSPEETILAFAAHQREHDELEPLRRLAKLRPMPKRLRIVTVVGKQDLWWRWRAQVREHYEAGPYHEAIEALRLGLDATHLHHTIWSASMVIKNMVDGEGALLLPTSEGYDEPRRAWHEMRLLEILSDAARSV